MDLRSLSSELNRADKLFKLYMLCSSILIFKIMALIVFTILTRMRHKVFISEEDAKFFKGEVKLNNDVERIRRAVQNDLENILPFLFIAYLFLYTNPSSWLAYILFIAFVIVRILHSIVYAIFVCPQPTRAILWGIGFGITALMALLIFLDSLQGLLT
ncbi:microsomal glutathione S-transferase 1-like [Coccinella septempunctata]|uniref:microsomal glutathione S-transferase 1-like n=1 Tax=Coccinella septempunctata TaxID=41139 RepID=UPI001D06BED9|nr:microsomal glutathione S-transferase 1-like [Coccinella septempunctata]